MVVNTEKATGDSERELTSLLRRVLKPIGVKKVSITRRERSSVRGIVTTICPLEKTIAGKDFEVGLSVNHGTKVEYVFVDGKRFRVQDTNPRRKTTRKK